MIKRTILCWWRSPSGATAIEYALIAAGISLAIAGFIFIFGIELSDTYEQFSGWLDGEL